MHRDGRTDLERDEQVARALGRPVRNQHVPPFSEVEARVRRRTSSPLVGGALVGVVVLALIIGTVFAEHRTLMAQPGSQPTPASSSSPATWQERIVADAQHVQAQLAYWPLVPTYAPVEVGVQVETRIGCGVSVSPCLDYRFENATGVLVLQVVQGPAGCCLDAARPGAVRNIEVRPGVRAQYLVEQPQFGGPILWWVEDTARGPVYVAINSPVFNEDELIRIAGSMRPLPAGSVDPTAPQTVSVEGYQFTAQLIFDRAYGRQAADAAHGSFLEGLGLACTWTRTGPTVTNARELLGSSVAVVELAGYATVTTGMSGGRTGGFPTTPDYAGEIHVVCGMRDATGDYGAEIVVRSSSAQGVPVVSSFTVIPWRQ